MSRNPKVWWNKQKQAWCTELGGKRTVLAKGRANRKQADEKLRLLLREAELLATVRGSISVAKLCELFLSDAQENLEPRTYESYRYACQKFINLFGTRSAHTIEPLDFAKFSTDLKRTLGDTSRAILLRSMQRCFNWGVESRLIPPHQLGRIRKPRPKNRDRFLTDTELQAMLRGSNPKNHHRSGAEYRRLLLAMDWTMCRPGELARLEWSHVHLDRSVAILADHKTKRTGRPKIIPLIPKMKRLLVWLKARSRSKFCFVNSQNRPWTISSINIRMRNLKERIGLEDVVPYTIRHRAATNAILRTGDLKMTSLVLGHTSTATTERYTHLAQEHLVTFATKAIG